MHFRSKASLFLVMLMLMFPAAAAAAAHLQTLQHGCSDLCLVHVLTEVQMFQQFKASLNNETQPCMKKLVSAPYVNTCW